MASSSPSPSSLNLPSPTPTPISTTKCPLSLPLYFLSQAHFSKFKISCVNQLEAPQIKTPTKNKKQRKPRPSFADQVREKWSVKPTLSREKFPWQMVEEQVEQQEFKKSVEFEEDEEEEETLSRIDNDSLVSDSVSFNSVNVVEFAPSIQEIKPRKQSFDFEGGNSEKDSSRGKVEDGFVSRIGNSESSGSVTPVKLAPWVQKSKARKPSVDFDARTSEKDSDRSQIDNGCVSSESKIGNSPMRESVKFDYYEATNSQKHGDRGELDDGFSVKNRNIGEEFVKDDEIQIGLFKEKEDLQVDMDESERDHRFERLPWEGGSEEENIGGDVFKNRSNTPLAEKLIPEFELKRLRNKASRMVERFRVGAAGITQELVDSIHKKWKEDEVVKLKFKGLSALNMKRIHESLESRTGGLVIWRSGSLVVLFRGMAYKLPCVQSFTGHRSRDSETDFAQNTEQNAVTSSSEASMSYSGRYVKDLTKKELRELKEFNLILDGLGPRFKDWSGRDPLPVDADLLPPVVEGYKRPFRLLPYGIKPGLLDKQTTFFRRTARTMPPHFALGRNRELQGLALAMVKLWERSAIAKIAIKRGVHNTCNERMAEELKRLTGGTLLSRNKDYIVFYRGNDFLPPSVTKTLTEAQELRTIQQDEEDQARQRALTLVNSTPLHAAKGPLVAGTLAETVAATSKWGNQPSSEEIAKMKRDSAVARHASLVRLLEKKLALAKGKMRKAEKALAKVQEYLQPSELPTDLETITDEERFTLRKIGLSMKPFLVLGRRGVFDGTVENMHLHWKYRELVKIMVERKSFAQVKHVAISLESESGGVLVSVDKTTKGYAIIVYRGKNYQRPEAMRPKNLLTRRQALARSIELQRREALKHHISDLHERMEKLKMELEDMKTIDQIDEETLRSRVEDNSDDDVDDDMAEDEDEEAYLETYKDDD